MKRWCQRCGRQKPADHFRPDASRPKRLVAIHCLRCEVATFMNRRGNHARPRRLGVADRVS